MGLIVELKMRFQISLAQVSKNLREGNETGRECEK